MMAKKRYDRKEATQWAIRQFPEYDDVEQVFKSCYDNTSHPQNMKQKTGRFPYATVDEIKDFPRRTYQTPLQPHHPALRVSEGEMATLQDPGPEYAMEQHVQLNRKGEQERG